MGLSIQDYLKKINSWLTVMDIVSLFVTFLVISLFAMYISQVRSASRGIVVYKENYTTETESSPSSLDNGKPFGSRQGKTYTFSWCSGSKNIKTNNKIFFASPEEAEAKGRTLSKLCKK